MTSKDDGKPWQKGTMLWIYLPMCSGLNASMNA